MDRRTERGSSRRVGGNSDLGSRRGSSGRARPRFSLAALRGSSVPSRFSRGGLFVPVLLSGPSAVAGETSAIISWTLDPDGPAAYHRVRSRLQGTSEWTVGAWSSSTSYEASRTISDLDPGIYEYQIESALGPGYVWTTGFLPATPGTFEIEETGIELTNLSWGWSRTSITANYETSEPTKCKIIGRKHGDFLWSTWINVTSEHTSHSHIKTGLLADTIYDIRIELSTDEGKTAKCPLATSHYMVKTAPEIGIGGGYQGIEDD